MAKRTGGVSAARRSGISTPTVVAVVVVVLVAVVVIGGVLLTGGGSGGRDASAPGAVSTSEPIPVVPAGASYPTTVRPDGVIVAGGPAPQVLDVYEDALCPGCQQFEQRAAEPLARAITEGRLQVRYHMVNLLEQMSSPPGYSSAAGNAIICAAANGAFPTVHTSLYAAQPSERGAGYTTDQLVDLGNRAGAGPGYAACVTEGRYTGQVAQNFQRASNDPNLRQESGSFGTPSLVLDGRLQTLGESPALDAVLGSG